MGFHQSNKVMQIRNITNMFDHLTPFTKHFLFSSVTDQYLRMPYFLHTYSGTVWASAFDFIGLPAMNPSEVTTSCVHVLPQADTLPLNNVSVYILVVRKRLTNCFLSGAETSGQWSL
jgi:hypothetical protein